MKLTSIIPFVTHCRYRFVKDSVCLLPMVTTLEITQASVRKVLDILKLGEGETERGK